MEKERKIFLINALAKGVNLHVIQTEKFKTVRILVRFTTAIDRKKMAGRALLANLMETNTEKYPVQTDVSLVLAEMYGASFGAYVSRKGQTHSVNVEMTIVNEHYLPTKDTVLQDAVAFLQEVLFAPNLNTKKNAFEAVNFEREKANMLSYIDDIADDKQTYASIKAQELYFGSNQAQGIPSFGTKADVEVLTAEDIFATYQEMINENQVNIFVVGDVEDTDILPFFEVLPFADRPIEPIDIFYEQAKKGNVLEASEEESVTQAKLNLVYQANCYFQASDYFAALIFNGLFGGFPHSKLFINVREKASLAYYASSSLDFFRGTLMVQTGIDQKKREQVVAIIAEQLSAMQAGEFSDEDFEQTKTMLKNQYLQGLDAANAMIEKTFTKIYVPPANLSVSDWLVSLENVNKSEVQQVAKKVYLQSIFLLQNETSGEEEA